VLLYTVEAAAIASLMSRDAGKADTELSTALSALPSRKMFPAPLTPIKDALAHTLAAGANTLAPSSTAAAAVLSAAAAGLAEQQAEQAAAPLELVAAPPGKEQDPRTHCCSSMHGLRDLRPTHDGLCQWCTAY
jgi:hypothetical protein